MAMKDLCPVRRVNFARETERLTTFGTSNEEVYYEEDSQKERLPSAHSKQ